MTDDEREQLFKSFALRFPGAPKESRFVRPSTSC